MCGIECSVNLLFWLVIRGWDDVSVSETKEYSVTLFSCQNAKYSMEISLVFPSTSSKQYFISVSISTKSRSFRHFLPILFPYSPTLCDKLRKSYLLTLSFGPSGLSLYIDTALCCQDDIEFSFSASPTLCTLGSPTSSPLSTPSSLSLRDQLAFFEERAGVLVASFRMTLGEMKLPTLENWCLDGPQRWMVSTFPSNQLDLIRIDFTCFTVFLMWEFHLE